MALTKNPNVLKWLDEMVALTTPDQVVWIDGSEEQLEALREEALRHRRDDQAQSRRSFPAAMLHRTAVNDVARVEGQNLYLLPEARRMQAPPTTGMDPKVDVCKSWASCLTA